MAISDDHRRDSDQPTMAEDAGRQRLVGRTPLYAVLSANAVSQVGDYMVAVALPWFVLQTTGSVVQMGFTGAVVGIGTLVSSISGGPLVDRFGFRRASILSDVTAGAAVAGRSTVVLGGCPAVLAPPDPRLRHLDPQRTR
jgi:MFS family permease